MLHRVCILYDPGQVSSLSFIFQATGMSFSRQLHEIAQSNLEQLLAPTQHSVKVELLESLFVTRAKMC